MMRAFRLTLDRYEPLNGLQKYADSKSQQEDTVEEGAEETSSLPTEREISRGLCPL